jgi:hypothetical protein
MVRTGNRRLSRRLALLGTAMYALFLVASPFEHHDLSCELKTPQHCTSCSFTQLGSDPQILLPPAEWHLADAGRAVAVLCLVKDTLIAAHSAGRSPPFNA